MTRRRLPISGAAIILAALLLTSCSGDQGASKGDPVAGKELFAANGCNGCHTFKAAGSTGTTGPDLDTAGPSPAKVMHQLDNPGGLMPSFADKLSDDEKRNLAAFVGASNASGKAVTAPFRPDSKRLADCRDGNFECLEQAFGNLTYNEGPKPALARLQTMSTTNSAVAGDCHRIAHRMGSAALSRFKDKVAPAFIAGTPVCASGYYHGIIERAFLGQPTDKLGVVSRQMCVDSQITKQTFLLYQCIHGLGHGLMIYTGYDLPRLADDLQGAADRVRQDLLQRRRLHGELQLVLRRELEVPAQERPDLPLQQQDLRPVQGPVLRARHGEPPEDDRLRPEEDRRRLQALGARVGRHVL